MTRFASILMALALAAGATPVGAAQTAGKAAAPKAEAAKGAPSRPAPRAGAYDATNPQTLSDLLVAAGAKVASTRREDDSVFVGITSTAANFSVQFAGCNTSGRACQAVLFDALMDLGGPTLAQINAFNQSSVVCRIYQDKQAKPHATYAALLLKSDTAESGGVHLAAWQGCLAEAAAFVRDPNAYLATAP